MADTFRLDRKNAPAVREMERIDIQTPEYLRLPNGIGLMVLRAGTEDAVRMDILIGAGIWHQEQPLQALFTNRMLREGTKGADSADIAEMLDSYGAWMELNTSVNYSFVTLYSLGKFFSRTLPIVSSLVREPSFPEKELKIVLESNRQQLLVNNTKVNVVARKEFNRALFGSGHPCGRYAVPSDYDKLTTAHLRTFYARHYHSGNCTIILSGNVTEEIISLVEKELGTAPWGEVSAPTPLYPHTIPPFAGRHLFVEHPQAVQSALFAGAPMMAQQHPDFTKARVMVTLLGGYFGSRLMKNIRERNGYTYGISSGIQPQPGCGILLIATQTANEHVEACIREIRHEMSRLREELVPPQELSMVKSYMLGEVCRSCEGPFSLSDAWIYVRTASLPDDFYVRTVEDICHTTVEDIRTMACKYLHPENLLEVVVGAKTALH